MPVVVADQNYTSNEPTKQDMIDKYEEGDLVERPDREEMQTRPGRVVGDDRSGPQADRDDEQPAVPRSEEAVHEEEAGWHDDAKEEMPEADRLQITFR